MHQIQELVERIMTEGRMKDDRTGIGTRSIFGHQMRFNLADGFPIVTTKFTPFKVCVRENLWFFTGKTNIKPLVDKGVHIWDLWALKEKDVYQINNVDWGRVAQVGINKPHLEDGDWDAVKLGIERETGEPIDNFLIHQLGDLGPVYGAQLRDFNGVDQFKAVFHSLRDNPKSRRHIVSYWNPGALPIDGLTPEENVMRFRQALAPCHAFFQFNCVELYHSERYDLFLTADRFSEARRAWAQMTPRPELTEEKLTEAGVPIYRLDLQLYQRSCDVPIGCPVNVEGYSLINHMFAHCLNYEPGYFVHTLGDAHIYANQMTENLTEWRRRTPLKLPKLIIDTGDDVVNYPWEFKEEHFRLEGYEHHGKLHFEVAK